MNSTIQFHHASVGYDYPLIEGISFALKHHTFLGIMGTNGSGKSTILKAIIGESTLFDGEIVMQGKKRNPNKESNILTQGILYLHTGSSLFLGLTVQEHRYMIGKNIKDKKSLGERMDRIEKNIAILTQWKTQPIASLSGGQRQLVMLSLAVLVLPPILLLDEPTVGISEKRQPLITAILSYLQVHGVSGIIVDHHQTLLNQRCDTIITLD